MNKTLNKIKKVIHVFFNLLIEHNTQQTVIN